MVIYAQDKFYLNSFFIPFVKPAPKESRLFSVGKLGGSELFNFITIIGWISINCKQIGVFN